MCVITICRNNRETEENLIAMEETNKDGTGVIFYKDGFPHYKKNIKIEEAIALNKTLEFPYAFHFRFTTVGQNKLLTHPFEVTPDSELREKGTAKMLLMHNGHWANWDDTLNRYAINAMEDLPDGDWSDSRAMAFLAAAIGPNILKTITGQRVALFDTGKKITLLGNGWVIENGIAYSNKTWAYKNKCYTYEYGKGWNQTTLQFKNDKKNKENKNERRDGWLTEEDIKELRALQVGENKVEKE